MHFRHMAKTVAFVRYSFYYGQLYAYLEETAACKKSVCIEPYVLLHHFSSTLILSRERERMVLCEEKGVRVIADIPEVHDAVNLFVYLRYMEICSMLSSKAETPAINRGRENNRYLI